jgi:hypothetical protein
MWADRLLQSDLAAQLPDGPRLAAAWQEWAAAPDGWFLVPHGEIIARG